MQPPPVTRPSYETPATAEEAVLLAMTRLGRRMRTRLPGEQLDFTAIVLLKALLHGGPVRLSTLAGMLDVDASTVSRQVRQLEDRGLIERMSDPDDGRACLIALSEEGRSRLEEGAQRRRRLVGELVRDWDAGDREQLRLLLTRLLDNLDRHQETS